MSKQIHNTVLVVPCYNEAERLDQAEFVRLIKEPGLSVLFVDDGSTDNTHEVLTALVAQNTQKMAVLALDPNRGKGEAVRRGLLAALQRPDEPQVVAFIDADLATPVDEVIRLTELALSGEADALIGSRIAFLGADIDRKPARHYLGRVFATGASLALNVPVYDTQCGAKFFRVSPLLEDALSEEFSSRWAFDVELLGRILDAGGRIVEEPLRRWIDIPGSKISFGSMLKAGLDLVQIRVRLAKRRKR